MDRKRVKQLSLAIAERTAHWSLLVAGELGYAFGWRISLAMWGLCLGIFLMLLFAVFAEDDSALDCCSGLKAQKPVPFAKIHAWCLFLAYVGCGWWFCSFFMGAAVCVYQAVMHGAEEKLKERAERREKEEATA